jgi:putative ABC transport system substrate-binding protein
VKRREFISLLGGTAMWPLAARAQQPAMPVIGVLYGVSAAEWADHMVAFRRGLGETGFVEGRNVVIEYRWADGQYDRMPWMAADLIGRRVAVILMGGNTDSVRAMLAATQTIPIVFTTGTDPVAAGLVASLNRPGGNATGVTVVAGELGPKKLELLHELVPGVKKISVLVNPNNRLISEADIRGTQAAAPRLGLEVIVVNVGTEKEIQRAFATAVQQGAGDGPEDPAAATAMISWRFRCQTRKHSRPLDRFCLARCIGLPGVLRSQRAHHRLRAAGVGG